MKRYIVQSIGYKFYLHILGIKCYSAFLIDAKNTVIYGKTSGYSRGRLACIQHWHSALNLLSLSKNTLIHAGTQSLVATGEMPTICADVIAKTRNSEESNRKSGSSGSSAKYKDSVYHIITFPLLLCLLALQV